MDYDIRELEKLGEEYEKLQARLKDVRAGLHAKVLEAHTAGVRQVDIIRASRYTRDAVRVIIRDATLAKVDEALEQPGTSAERPRPKRKRPPMA